MKDGYVQSYIDFFLITDISLKNEEVKGIDGLDKFTTEKLIDLKNCLCEAEEHTKYIYPVKTPAIEGYHVLAEKFFDVYHDYFNAGYFYKRVI